MVTVLDAITKNKRQRGHAVARNMIAPKQKLGLGIGSKIPGFNLVQSLFTMLSGVDKKLPDKYWAGDIAKGAFNTKTGVFSKKFWTHPSQKSATRGTPCNSVTYDKKSGKWVNHCCD